MTIIIQAAAGMLAQFAQGAMLAAVIYWISRGGDDE